MKRLKPTEEEVQTYNKSSLPASQMDKKRLKKAIKEVMEFEKKQKFKGEI